MTICFSYIKGGLTQDPFKMIFSRITLIVLFILSIPSFPGYQKLQAQNWKQAAKVVASDRDSLHSFGFTVAISGNNAIIGDIKPHNGNTVSNESAYIFSRNNNTWTEVQILKPSDRDMDMKRFGRSVAISRDYALVGADFEDKDAYGASSIFHAGAVYIFHYDSFWFQLQKLVASDRDISDYFGYSVAISGEYAIIGAPFKEIATGGNIYFNPGAAYIFERDTNGNWLETQKIFASDLIDEQGFGSGVAIDSNFAVVIASGDHRDASGTPFSPGRGTAYVFEHDSSGNWLEVQKILPSDRFSGNHSFGGEGNRQHNAVDISGNTIVIGDPVNFSDSAGVFNFNSGAAYVFERDTNGNWLETQKITASDRTFGDRFGASVSVSGDYILIGADGEDHNAFGNDSVKAAGSAYLFARDPNGKWTEIQKIVASDRNIADSFAQDVALSGNHLVIGKPEEDLGINHRGGPGSAYFFEICVDPVFITFSLDTLTANLNNATYQWLDCSNGYAPVSGATQQSFTPVVNGSYAVAITFNGCTDTSACLAINNVSLKENKLNHRFNIYPNPAKDIIHLENVINDEAYYCTIMNARGQQLYTQRISGTLNRIDLHSYSPGLYFIRLENGEDVFNYKLVKR